MNVRDLASVCCVYLNRARSSGLAEYRVDVALCDTVYNVQDGLLIAAAGCRKVNDRMEEVSRILSHHHRHCESNRRTDQGRGYNGIKFAARYNGNCRYSSVAHHPAMHMALSKYS